MTCDGSDGTVDDYDYDSRTGEGGELEILQSLFISRGAEIAGFGSTRANRRLVYANHALYHRLPK